MARKEEVQVRMQTILGQLFRDGSLSAEQLAGQLNISIATVRRDLHRLQRQGRLRRTHGGAMPLEPLLYEPFRHDSSFQDQLQQNAEEKRRIAATAAELIANADTIALTPGTTTTQITRSMPVRTGVTIITNTVNIAMELSKRPDIEVLVIGGFLRGDWFSLVGPPALQSIAHLIPDKMFIGANGVHAQWGLTAFNPDEAAFNRALIARAKMKIAVVDHSKLGIAATYEFWPVDQLDLLITDSGASDELIAPFLARGVEVQRV
jgi:DeoR family transcriptional regulator of aga operon